MDNNNSKGSVKVEGVGYELLQRGTADRLSAPPTIDDKSNLEGLVCCACRRSLSVSNFGAALATTDGSNSARSAVVAVLFGGTSNVLVVFGGRGIDIRVFDR